MCSPYDHEYDYFQMWIDQKNEEFHEAVKKIALPGQVDKLARILADSYLWSNNEVYEWFEDNGLNDVHAWSQFSSKHEDDLLKEYRDMCEHAEVSAYADF